MAANLLTIFVYPLNQVLLLACIALVLLQRRRLRAAFIAMGTAAFWLYLCSTSLFANSLMAYLERQFVPRAMSVIEPAQVIVLLGGAIRGDTHMGTLPDLNQQADRLVAALALYKAGKAPRVLLSGGGHPEDRSEAAQMRDLLEVMGVPATAMILETSSRNTHDNARYSAQLLALRDVKSILLVTSAFHMPRAAAAFRAQGLDVVAAPTDFQRLVSAGEGVGLVPGIRNLNRTTLALHEIVGYQVYRWRGWL